MAHRDSRGPSARPRTRELLAHLYRIGGRQKRCRGSHATWQLPSGHTIVVPIGHIGREVTRTVLAHVRRVLRAAGLELGWAA